MQNTHHSPWHRVGTHSMATDACYCGYCVSERVSDWPKVTQHVSGRAKA